MRRVATALNETEAKVFDKKLEQLGMTESQLIEQVKTKHPEFKSLTATAIIDIALRRLAQN